MDEEVHRCVRRKVRGRVSLISPLAAGHPRSNLARRLVRVTVCAGMLIAPASTFAAGWVYTDSNNPAAGQNSVLALDYGAAGKLSPVHIREYRTFGTGAPLVVGHSSGTLAGDHAVELSPNRKWLFAVNQGSNTIAVFKVDTATGKLTPVHGSPFPSGGVAPISVGATDGRLVVANHGQAAPRTQVSPFDPAGPVPPGLANFVSFSVSKTGRLTRLSTVMESRAGLTDAVISPLGRNVFSTGFYSLSLYSLTLSAQGRLAEAPGSPAQFPASLTAGITLPPFLPPAAVALPFGIAVHPTRPYVYFVGALSGRIAIYKYDDAGALSFAGQAENTGAIAACWAVISSDGRHLYTGNSASQDVTLFDVSPSGAALTFVELVKLPSMGTTSDLALDVTNRYLYAIGGHDDPDGPRPQGLLADHTIVDAPADGNFVDAFAVAADGRLTPISSTPLPIRLSQLPYGLATLRKG